MIKSKCHCHADHHPERHLLMLMSCDVESFVLKVCNAFSHSSKILLILKIVQEVYHQILRHIPVRWLTLLQATDRLLLSWQSKILRES